MHKLLQREYVSRVDCRKILDQASGLSRREASALSGHIQAIFNMADGHPPHIARGDFIYRIGEQNIPVSFKRAIGGNADTAISSAALLALAPSLANTPTAQLAADTAHSRLSYLALELKSKDQLRPEWKTLADLEALMQTEAKRVGRHSPFSKFSRIAIGQLANAFTGETGVAHGVACHKFKSHGRMTVAIHEDSVPQLFEYLEETLRCSGHRSVQSRLANQRTSFER